MTFRKPRRPNNNPRHHNNNNTHYQPSDYESDYPNYLSDAQPPQIDQYQDQQENIPPIPIRSNEELNLAVLRRHNPHMNSIVSLAPYAVVYVFNPSSRQWEKSGVEGSLFVCNLTQGALGEERYSAFVLNRRGLNNFDVPLTDGENVEITEEYVILKSDEEAGLGSQDGNNNNNGVKPAGDGNDVRIYGLWIYSEPPPNSTAQARTLNAQMIRECAMHAGHSLRLARERREASQQNGLHMAAEAATTTAAPLEEVQSSVPMGRQVSLKDLFGQQRAQDDGWTVRAHQFATGMGEWPQHQPQPQPPMGMPPSQSQQQDVLGDLFRRAGLTQGGQAYT